MGALEIQNKLKNLNPFLKNPNSVTDMNTNRARNPVTAIWLVKVKLYGNKPRTFPARISKKSENMKGKYFKPSLPAISTTIEWTNEYIISTEA